MNVDLTACIDGDASAWEDFVARCSGIVYAAVRRSLAPGGLGERVDDVVQDVFVRLIKDDYRLLRTYTPERAALSTWLTLVARSVALDHQRKRRLPSVPLDALPEPSQAPERGPSSPAVPLHLLTARQQLVLVLLFDEGRSVEEAARLLDVDPQTVRSTKHKALSRLREHLLAGEEEIPGIGGTPPPRAP